MSESIKGVNPVIVSAMEHFASRSGELKSIAVPEWNTTIYYKELSTFQEQSGIMQYHQQGKIVEALVETIIVKARKQDGTKMFNPADKLILMTQADPDVLVKIATALNSSNTDYNVEETVKN